MNACYDLEVDTYSLVKHICISTSQLHTCPHDIFACARLIYLHAMSQSFVTPYALHDDVTCLVNHLLNSWFCTNANHICFSMCLLFLLLLKESLDGATLDSSHFELQDDKYLVNVHFYTGSHLFPMVIWFSIRGRIFPKGGEMMRRILWTSPCQEFVWQVTRATSTSHT